MGQTTEEGAEQELLPGQEPLPESEFQISSLQVNLAIANDRNIQLLALIHKKDAQLRLQAQIIEAQAEQLQKDQPEGHDVPVAANGRKPRGQTSR